MVSKLISSLPDKFNVEDERWHKNRFGKAASARNIVLAVDDAMKAEGPHRVQRWLKSGTPVWVDDQGVGHLFDAAAKAGGKKIAGLVSSVIDIQDRAGQWYDTVPTVGIYTGGYIYSRWLPVEVAMSDFDPALTSFMDS